MDDPASRRQVLQIEQALRGAKKECAITRTQLSVPITFKEDDMLLRNTGHNWPLYFTRYMHEVSIPRIQIDPGSSINIMSTRMLHKVGLANCLIEETNVSIHGFNGQGGKAIGKIRIRCQIEDMYFQLTCYIIEASTVYNLLLGRPWIHKNCAVPSTLHQCFKYVGEDLKVRG